MTDTGLRQLLPPSALAAARRTRHVTEPLMEGVRRAVATDRRQLRARVQAAMELPPLPRRRRLRGSVWAVTMVKNEADIIDHTLRHLLRQGVDGIIVADNGSTDETVDIVSDLASASGRIHLAHDREPSYLQAYKMTHLSSAARAAGADWIVPFDADELWFAPDAPLADGLRALAAPKAVARMHCLFPREDSAIGDDSWRLDLARCPWWQQKVAFRSHPLASLNEGNHTVVRPGEQDPSLGIIHLPWRSFAQFRLKIRQGAAAIRAAGMKIGGDHWLDMDRMSDAELRREWELLLDGHGRETLGWHPRGTLTPCDPLDWASWDPSGLLPALGEELED